MPRILNPRRVPLKAEQVRERASRYKVTRLFDWVDPYPEILGTKPEKMVYAELTRRGIGFQFQDYLNTAIPDIEVNQWFRPDFIIPQYRLILEVQGAYWHTMPDKIEQDSLKFALYQMAGYRVLAWWDYDIESRLQELFDAEAELRSFGQGAYHPPKKDFQIDDLKGLRTSNKKHRKPWTHKPVAEKAKHKDNTTKLAYTKQRKPKRITML